MYLSIKEYAKRVNLGEAFIRSLAVSGDIPSIMVGTRKRKINVEEADRALKAYHGRKATQTAKLSFKERLALIRNGVQS